MRADINALIELNEIVERLLNQGCWQEALVSAKRAHSLALATVSPDDPISLFTVNNLGVALMQTGEYRTAITLLLEVLTHLESVKKEV